MSDTEEDCATEQELLDLEIGSALTTVHGHVWIKVGANAWVTPTTGSQLSRKRNAKWFTDRAESGFWRAPIVIFEADAGLYGGA